MACFDKIDVGKKYPGAGAFARARDFKRKPYAQLLTRLGESLRILFPVRFIEIDSEMASVIRQQRKDAEGAFTRKVIVDNRIESGMN